MPAVGLGRRQLEQSVELAGEAARIGLERRVGEFRAPPADGAGPLQEALEGGCEDAVAGIDGVLRVADQMREAVLLGVVRSTPPA